MFEGTSLDEAFASPMDHSTFAAGAAAGTSKPSTDSLAPRYDPSVYDTQEEHYTQQQQQPSQQPQQQYVQQLQQRAQPVVENFQPHMYATPAAPVVQQQQPQQYVQQVQQPYVPTLWDRMMEKRVDVARLVVVGLVIVFALSVDRTISHYLQDYLSRSVVTDVKELLIRAAYPIGVILVLWILKSL